MADLLVSQSEWAAMQPWGYVAPVPRASRVNAGSSKAEDRQLTLAADNAPIRFGYGRDRIGAQVVNILAHGSYIVVQLLWGYPLYSIEEITAGDKTLPTGTLRQDYLDGTQSTVDGWMEAAFAAQSPAVDYNDTLQGYSYTVLKIPKLNFDSGISFQAVVNWRRVYDYRTSTTVGTDNPSLALADWLTNSTYGEGLTVDSASVIAAANWNDTLLSGEKQRLIGWTVNGIQKADTIRETLRLYASVFLVRRGSTIHFVCDKAESSVATYTHAAGQIAAYSAAEKADMGDAPTIVEVKYTDTSKKPWRDRSAFSPPVAGETVRRLSTVQLNGIQRYSQAYREAVERVNKLNGNDLSFSVTVFDIGIAHEVGDVVTITLPYGGITGKPMRVNAVEKAGPGMWKLGLTEYDPAVYSSEVNSASTYEDTMLESPGEPPDLTTLTAAQDLYQIENGIWIVRAVLTITPPTYLWTAGYDIEVWDGTTLVHAGRTEQTTYRTPPLQDLKTYNCKARLVSTVGAVGAWKEALFTADGKTAIPGDVPSISGFEVAGDIYLSWGAASDLDIWRYELRWGSTGGSWATAALLDRVDALRYVSRGVLTAGTHRIWIKAMDSIRQYSTNAVSVDVTVTIDPDALQTTYDQFTPDTPTDMSTATFGVGGDTYYVTEHGTACASILTANPLGTTYDSQPVAAAQTNATNTYKTTAWDAGVDLTGDWTCAIDETKFSTDGTCEVKLYLKAAAAGAYTAYTSFPVKTTARYAYIEVTGTGEFTVLAGSESVTCYAVTQKEYDTNVAIAATGTVITLDGHYFAHRAIVVTPLGSDPIYATVDAITLHSTSDNTFTIWLFDDAGNATTGNVDWRFEGV